MDPTSTAGSVAAFRLGDFGFSNITDGDARTDGLGTVLADVARLFNPMTQPNGSVDFLFGGSGVGAGVSSHSFFLHTSATDYAQAAQYDLVADPGNGSISILYPTFAPVAIPEVPAGALGLGLAAGVLVVVSRFRKST